MAIDPAAEFADTGEAVQVMERAARFLAGARYQELPAQMLADVLAGMELVDAVQAAIRGRVGQVFTGTQAHLEWGQQSLGVWYRHETKVTVATANANKVWARRQSDHPVVMDALADGGIVSESWARQIMTWTGNLPDEFVAQADQIMMEAAAGGVDLAGLARIAAEFGALLAEPDKDRDKEPGPGLQLDLTFEGAGVLHGDLTPACAAKVKAVLEPLAAAMKQPGDDRTHQQKMHDALEEAMTRLLAARLVPQSQGSPSTAIAHIHFADLVEMDQDSVLLDKWKTTVTAQWAAERAGVAVQPGDGGCWLTGDEARRFAVDAMIVPVVTATLDATHLASLIAACLAYHHAAQVQAAQDQAAQDQAAQDGQAGPGSTDGAANGEPTSAGWLPGGVYGPAQDLDDITRRILGIVIAIASGTASYLRRNQLGKVGLAGPSLPLDVGETDHIPAQIRRAVLVRDRGTCAAPGGCGRPAMRSDQHHTRHKAHGGPTSLANIGLFCQFHHDYLIHILGWSITIEPDGTMTARKPNGSIYKRSHPPPPRPG